MNEIFPLESANADFITDFLVIGGDLDYDTEVAATQAVELTDTAAVTHVLDCRLEARERLWKHFPEIAYRWDGIDDRDGATTSAWFERNTAWAVDAVERGGTVLAHCHMGINRGPSAGYAILLRLGWDPIDALSVIRIARPIANIAFAEEAIEWHLDRIGAGEDVRAAWRARVAQWRHENPLDVVRVIRTERNRGRRQAA
jgi:predicted protein tyrosine phosphatase